MKKPVLAFVISALMLTLTGCVGATEPETESAPAVVDSTTTDPRYSWVVVSYDSEGAGAFVRVIKRCDGLTLMYVSTGSNSGAHSISTVPDSPECYG